MIEISERISYAFSVPVATLSVELRMSSLPLLHPVACASALTISPEPGLRKSYPDVFGNVVVLAEFDQPLRRLVVSAYHRIEGLAPHAFLAPVLPLDLTPENAAEVPVPAAAAVTRKVVTDLTREIRRDWRTDPFVTSPHRPLADIERTRRGVCQDMARLAVDRLRRRRIPARIMVGYAIDLTRRPPAPRHAWIAAYCDGAWAEFDVANVSEARFATAWGGPLDAIGPIKSLGAVEAQTSFAIEAHLRAL